MCSIITVETTLFVQFTFHTFLLAPDIHLRPYTLQSVCQSSSYLLCLKTISGNSHAHLCQETEKVVWVLSFWPFTNSDQYSFQILLCQMDISSFSWQKKVTKMCPKYLLTPHQNLWSSQNQIQINRTGDINNVHNFEVFTNTNMAVTRIVCPICTVISSRAQLDIMTWWLACQTLEPQDVFSLLFLTCYETLLRTRIMELYKWQIFTLLNVLYLISYKCVGWG